MQRAWQVEVRLLKRGAGAAVLAAATRARPSVLAGRAGSRRVARHVSGARRPRPGSVRM